MNTLFEKTKNVACLRKKQATLSEQLAEKRREFEEANAGLIEQLHTAKEQLSAEETVLREMAIAEYYVTGNKNVGPGLGIRATKVLRYDEEEAYKWAINHRMALKLDKRAFEKIAKASTPEFVKIEEEPTATIASDLESAMGESDE